MAIILNIDTSTENASVSIAKQGEILAVATNNIQKEHASFLHPAIKLLLSQTSLDIKQLDSIAVTQGPGSYTGLRVGMASAKGLAYALKKPFITVGTLPAIALAAAQEESQIDSYYCPMIDARRMEVFTALYNIDIKEILPVCAIILTAETFKKELEHTRIVFCGSGSVKWRKLAQSTNCFFEDNINVPVSIAKISEEFYMEKKFTELIHSQPLYVKEFYNNKL